MPDRSDAFVSYSHADQHWLSRLKVHLRPLERDHGVVIWEDTYLRSGQRWRQEIDQALAKAKVAILLVSPDFLASDFVHHNELPPLLEAAAKEGLTILSVIVSACAFHRSPLHEFQAINSPDTPLDAMTPAEANKTLVKLFRRVDELFAAAPHAPVPAPAAKASEKEPKKEPAPPTPAPALQINSSQPAGPPPLLALLVKSDGQWEAIAVSFSQIRGGGEINLTLQPATPMQRAFLASLTQRATLGSIVYNEQTYPCQLRDLSAVTEGGRTESWKLVADSKEMPRSNDLMYFVGSPEEYAQSMSRLLLLNERPTENNGYSPFGVLSSISEDYINPLFALYHHLGRKPEQFNQVAPLVASWYLQMGRMVTDIFRLEVQVVGAQLVVDFEGQRNSSNQEAPTKIAVKGRCKIPKDLPAEALPLRLSK
jgi:hypothetical protein